MKEGYAFDDRHLQWYKLIRMTRSTPFHHARVHQAPRLRYHLLDTGYCLASEHHLIQGGRRRIIRCHSLVGLLQHPTHGWFLWDTGYAPRMLEATERFPFSLYRRVTPLRLAPEQAVKVQLERSGLASHDIRQIIISHFHADHVSGLKDFPSAKLIAHHSAYADVASRCGFGAVRRGYLPDLIPADFHQRTALLPRFKGPPLPGLGATYDLWGDESVRLVELPGHARGQIGMLAHTTDGLVFFVADACWMRRSIDEDRPPSRLTHLFVDDGTAVRQTINALHRFAQAYPDVRIVPTHCPETYADVFGQDQQP